MRTLIGILVAGALGIAAAPPAHSDDRATGEWPLRPVPEVVARFDPPDSEFGAGHRGVDLRGSPGQQVHAALAGTITFAGTLAGRGVVVVDHVGTRTTYEPVRATVAVGAAVPAGAAIGRLEVFGSHCFPASCLHWGWIRNVDDVYLDPLLLVGAGPIRLLPLWREEPVGPAVAVLGLAQALGWAWR